jgi:integrase
LTGVDEPALPKWERSGYIPHAFTEAELAGFFHACDTLPGPGGTPEQRDRRVTVPVFFRLLYSSGIRTIEARLLGAGDVDLREGVLDIRRSKGPGQHYVALHPSMTELMGRYDTAMGRLRPGRECFFPARNGGPHTAGWVQDNFRRLWAAVSAAHAVPYQLRHNYAVTNINQLVGQGAGFEDRLLSLSKSMGHATIKSTLAYYRLVPRVADIVEDLTGPGFDEIIPEAGNG